MARSQFVVPQFLDIEPKIIGPITVRQFIIILGVVLIDFIIYRVFLSLLPILGLGIPITVLGFLFAFVKVNGQPMHFIALNMLQTVRRPRLRVWDKRLSDSDLAVYLRKEVIPTVAPMVRKAPLTASRLAELTLVVDTGGVYEGNEG